MPEVPVRLSVQDAASSKIASISRELAQLAKVAKQAGSPDAGALARGAGQLQNVADNFGQVGGQATRAAKSIDTAKASIGAFTNAAGLGMAKSLVGLGGAVAFAAAAGKVISDGIRLAAQFERITQRSAFSLALGNTNVLAQMNALKQASLQYAGMGMNGIQAAQMISGYGQAAGATVQQSIGAGPSIARYARAFGLDPEGLASQMGVISQYAGKNVGRNAGEIFGAAQASGDAGRRIPELLGNAVTLLTQIQAANPFGHDSLKSALSEIVGITRIGPAFQNAQVLQNTMGGLSQLGSGISASPYLTSVAMRAGFKIPDILFGIQGADNLSKITQRLYKDTGGNRNMISQIISQAVPGAQGRDLMEAIMATGGRLNGKYRPMADKAAAALAGQAQGTTSGQLDQIGAHLQNAELKIGDKIVTAMAPLLLKTATSIDGMATALTNLHLPEGLGGVSTALKAVAVMLGAQALLSGGGKAVSLLKGLGGLLGAGGRIGGTALRGLAMSAGVDVAGLEAVTGIAAGSVAAGALGGVGLALIPSRTGLAGDKEHRDMVRYNDQRLDRIRRATIPQLDEERVKATIGYLESGGNYRASSDRPGDRSYGKYQWTPDTLAGMWSWDKTTKAMSQKYGKYSPKLYKYLLDHPRLQEDFMDATYRSYVGNGARTLGDILAAHNTGAGDQRHPQWGGMARYQQLGRPDSWGYDGYVGRGLHEYQHPHLLRMASGTHLEVTTHVREVKNPSKSRTKATTHR